MLRFLKEADERQEDDEVVRFWVNVVREAAYDLEDVIDSFVLKVAIRRGGGARIVLKRFACMWNEGVQRYKIRSGLWFFKDPFMQRLRALQPSFPYTMQSYEIKQRKGSEGAGSFARQREHRLTYAHVSDDHDVVGIGKEVEKLSTYLVEEKSCRILSGRIA